MYKPLNESITNIYRKSDQKIDANKLYKYTYPTTSQVLQKEQIKQHQYEPKTNNNSKRSQSIPVPNNNKENKVKVQKCQQNTQQYFQKQLQIRTLQSKKLLQQLQQTQKNLLKVQKESWMIKNDYESQKRKNEKLQRQNTRLIQQISILEEKLKQVSLSIGNKVQQDKEYLQKLQDLKNQIDEKQIIIQKLNFQNDVLVRSKEIIKKQNVITNREEYREITKNNYVGDYVLNMNRTIDLQKISDLESTNKSLLLPFQQSTLDLDSTKYKQRKQQHKIYIPNSDLKTDYLLKNKYKNLFPKQNRYLEPRRNYHSNDNRNQTINYSFDKNQTQQKYFNNYHPSKNDRKYSSDYVKTNHSLTTIIPVPYTQDKLTSHRNRRDRANNSIIQRCKMMLNY